MRPSVLMVTGEYPPGLGGVGDYTALISTYLARSGALVTVLTRADSHKEVASAGQGQVQLLRIVEGWGFRSWPLVAAAAQRCEARVVHLQYQAAAFAMHPAANLLPGYLRIRLPQVKVVTTFHDLRVPYLFPKAGPLRRAAIRALDLLSHASVLTNQADLDALGGIGQANYGRRPKRWLIPLGSNIESAPPPDYDRHSWRRRSGAGENTLLLSYFGFMNDTKGVEYLLEALRLLLQRGIEARLIIVGGQVGETDLTNRRYASRIDEMIQSWRLEEQMVRTGFVPPQEVSAFLLSSDICVLPFRDGASLRRGSLLAALTHGLPVVTTFPAQAEPLLIDGVNVTLVERDNPNALADALQRLWSDPALRRRLAAGATELAKRFRWPTIAARHLEMYERLLAE